MINLCVFIPFFFAQPKYIQRLKAIRATLLRSEFFQTHEVIGSSLLFVHDRTQASIWLIDFAKTVSLPAGSSITHINEWIVGNHEDGYLIGINNLIQIFEELLELDSQQEQYVRIEANANVEMQPENEYNDDGNQATSKPTDCSSANDTTVSASMQTEDSNMNLPLEIDAMKIDQQLNRDRL